MKDKLVGVSNEIEDIINELDNIGYDYQRDFVQALREAQSLLDDEIDLLEEEE